MEKTKNPSKKAETKVSTAKDEVIAESVLAKSATKKTKPVAHKAKALSPKDAKQATSHVTAAAETVAQVHQGTVKRESAAEKADASDKKSTRKGAQGEATMAVKAKQAKHVIAAEESGADDLEKAKGAFTKKMDEVKSAATAIGHKIAEVAKDANKKSETFEDAIANGLHEMKKDIHQLAVNVAEKTKE